MAGMRQARTLILTTSQGEDALFIQRMTVNEELGRLFRIELELVSERSDLNFEDYIAQNVTLRVEPPGGAQRVFNGHITRFGQAGMTGQLHAYQATVHPWLWFLTRNADCRIFQHQTVPDIVKQVFRDRGFTDFEERLSGSYRPWEYCVQYRETDFNFASRLLENEGIYYYFKHESGKHTLVLSDSVSAHARHAGYEHIPYYPPDTHPRRERDHIYDWRISHEIQPGAYALDDYDFERPKASLKTRSVVRRPHAHADFEIYDYPGDYLQSADGETYARARIEELQWQYRRQQGEGNALGLAVGNLFELTDYPREDQNREYLLVAARYVLESSAYETLSGAASSDLYQCSFTCIPSDQQYRPPRTTPKPTVRGPQTAVVTGKPGEEIWTDEHGRVKVHFHWDRHGKEDENSSCWMRVSQVHAGRGFGGIDIPRVGEEIIISFLEGDPDRPIITGRVYNGDNKPPTGLPAAGMVSGLKSNSTPGGGGYNEMTMDDTKGKEKITIHAQYDMNTTVEHDQTSTINNKRSTTIVVDDALNVNANRTVHVKGRLAETVDAGQNVTVTAGYKETISGGVIRDITGDSKTTVSAAIDQSSGATTDMHATGAGTYTSDTSLKLAVAGSAIDIGPAAITISSTGSTIKIDASGVSINGAKISLNG